MEPLTCETTTGVAVSDGRRLGWSVSGTGEPTVVLEAGLSGGTAGWSQVAIRLSPLTRVVSYDRAGYGGSDPVAPTPEQVVADLLAVLHDSGAHEPVVLVGHSWGGVLARLFAAAHPERVAALVLVDATHESLPGARSRVLGALNTLGSRLVARRARSGRVQRDLAAGRGRLARVAASVPVEHRPAMVAHLSAPGTWEQSAREAATVPALLDAVEAAPRPAVPVTAVVGGGVAGGRDARTRRQVRDVYEQWLGADRVLVVDGAGHMLPLEAPAPLAAHVARVVTTVRASP